MDCINLQEQFGQQYRITFDPAYNPKHVPRDKLDAWMMLIPCRRGVIYPHGGDLLIVEVDGRRVTANRLATWTAPRRIKKATIFCQSRSTCRTSMMLPVLSSRENDVG